MGVSETPDPPSCLHKQALIEDRLEDQAVLPAHFLLSGDETCDTLCPWLQMLEEYRGVAVAFGETGGVAVPAFAAPLGVPESNFGGGDQVLVNCYPTRDSSSSVAH